MSIKWKVFYKNWLTTHIEWERHRNESISNMFKKPEIDKINVNNNN